MVAATNRSSLLTVIGLLVAIIAIIGTQILGWGWGAEETVPRLIGLLVAGVAVVVVARQITA